MLLVCIGLLPVLLAIVLRLIRNRRAREICAVAFTFLVSGAVGWLLWSVETAGANRMLFLAGDGRTELFRLSEDFVCALRLDGAGKIYIGLAALLWPLATLYAVEYMRHEEREGNFYTWFLLAYGAAIFLAAAENLFTLYIFYELLTMCTVPLVWHKRDEESTKAALTYMLYLIGGAALGFAAVVLLPWAGGEDGRFFLYGNLPMLSLQMGYSMGGTMGNPAYFFVDQKMQWIALLGFVGFGVKAAVLPLCRWLPKASVAPTPVTALLHAVAVVNAGVFAVLRVLYYELPPSQIRGHWAQTVMLILSAGTLLYAAVMAVREQHVKRRLAWSTVSNLSYMLLGLSLTSKSGLQAGLAHMIFHSLAKIILFFCAGAVLTQTGRTQVRQMHGLGRKMPLTFAAFTVAGLSLVGVPPFPGFLSKYALVTAAFESSSQVQLVGESGVWPIVGAVALMAATVLTVIYVMTIVFPAYFLPYHPEEGEALPRDPGARMKTSLIILTALLIAAAVFADWIMTLLQTLAGGGAI